MAEEYRRSIDPKVKSRLMTALREDALLSTVVESFEPNKSLLTTHVTDDLARLMGRERLTAQKFGKNRVGVFRGASGQEFVTVWVAAIDIRIVNAGYGFPGYYQELQ